MFFFCRDRQAVEAHVESLRSWTYQQLAGLRHSNGSPLLRMFGAHEEGGEHQGGIFQFQVRPHSCSQLGCLSTAPPAAPAFPALLCTSLPPLTPVVHTETAHRSFCPATLRQLLAFLTP